LPDFNKNLVAFLASLKLFHKNNSSSFRLALCNTCLRMGDKGSGTFKIMVLPITILDTAHNNPEDERI
jgi:hypothetical protein